jgi:hypothetical protein
VGSLKNMELVSVYTSSEKSDCEGGSRDRIETERKGESNEVDFCC